MLKLKAGDYRLELAPERGGSVTAFQWQEEPIFCPARGPLILDVACFPLVPFSNRIANGRFEAGGRTVVLAPNLPGSDHPHPLHGFGWLSEWTVVQADNRSATLEHNYPGREWPWPYHARQTVELREEGLTMGLALTNLGDSPMPAGLGFHPYFPRDPDTVYHALHRGEWRNSADCLPQTLSMREMPADWWDGAPVGARVVDTVYTHRDGPIRIRWPSRRLSAELIPGRSLPHTVVYTPADSDFFCVEPVSHMTDAVNRDCDSGLKWLAPGKQFSVSFVLAASLDQ